MFIQTTFCNLYLNIRLDDVIISDVPSKPIKLRVTDVSNRRAQLSWRHPDSDGGSEVTGYRIEHRKSSDVTWEWTNRGDVLTSDAFYNATGLKTGSEYLFRVAAINSAGQFKSNQII